jgi:hypothetical protein
MATTHPDARIGRRYPSPGVTVTWRVPRRKRWGRVHLVDEAVEVVNVSATGAAIVGPTVPELQVQHLLPVQCGDKQLVSRIRRIVPSSSDPDVSFYGVQFIDPAPDAIELLLSQVAVPSREELEELWNRAE